MRGDHSSQCGPLRRGRGRDDYFETRDSAGRRIRKRGSGGAMAARTMTPPAHSCGTRKTIEGLDVARIGLPIDLLP